MLVHKVQGLGSISSTEKKLYCIWHKIKLEDEGITKVRAYRR
jgi:hypothetical protein